MWRQTKKGGKYQGARIYLIKQRNKMPRVKLSIQQNNGKSDVAASTIASFPNGPLTNNMLKKVKWKVMQHAQNASQKKSSSSVMEICGERGKIKWCGLRTSSKLNAKKTSTSGTGDYNYFIAVYNKKLKKMEMFQTHSNSITPMVQQVANSNDNINNSLDHMDGRQRRAVLTHSFGSRMARKGLKDLELNAVTEDNIVGLDEIEQHLLEQGDAAKKRYENAGLKSEAEIALDSNRRQLLPYFDMEATDPHHAYPFTNMVTARESSAFKEFIIAMENAKNDEKIQELRGSEDTKWKEQILRRLPKIHNKFQGSEKKKERNIEFQKLLFQQCLQRFYWLGSRIKVQGSLETLVEKTNIPSEILLKCLSMFSDKQRKRRAGHAGGNETDEQETTVYYRSKYHTTKLIFHICVVTLMVEGYRNFDPAYLAKDLKISLKEMLKYFKQVGAKYEKYKKDNNLSGRKSKIPGYGEYLVRLPVPLQFPKLTRGR